MIGCIGGTRCGSKACCPSLPQPRVWPLALPGSWSSPNAGGHDEKSFPRRVRHVVWQYKASIERVQCVLAENSLSLCARSVDIHRCADHASTCQVRCGSTPFVCRTWDTTDRRSRLANSQHSQPFFPPHATNWLSAADYFLDRTTITARLF